MPSSSRFVLMSNSSSAAGHQLWFYNGTNSISSCFIISSCLCIIPSIKHQKFLFIIGKTCPDSAFALYDRSASSSPVHMPKVPTVYISTRQVEPAQKYSSLPPSHSSQYCMYHKEMIRGESPSTLSASTAGNVEKISPRSAQKIMKSMLKSERPFRFASFPKGSYY